LAKGQISNMSNMSYNFSRQTMYPSCVLQTYICRVKNWIMPPMYC